MGQMVSWLAIFISVFGIFISMQSLKNDCRNLGGVYVSNTCFDAGSILLKEETI
tara:strand:+ start:375 stop:536 length:162 start_codon:yes stop_codon:yes gene_type:complete